MRLLLSLSLICMADFFAPWNGAEAGIEKTNSRPENLMEISCSEGRLMQNSKGRVERAGQDLILWLPGYFPKESGLIFRNPKGENKTTFEYCGGTAKYDLVREKFDHDAPMMYLIENSGRKHFFHEGDDSVYSAKGGQAVLVTSQNSLSEDRSAIVEIMEAIEERRGAFAGVHFQDVFSCRLPSEPSAKSSKNLFLAATEFSGESAVVDAFASSEGEKAPSKKIVGTLRLSRKKGTWAVDTQAGTLAQLKCR